MALIILATIDDGGQWFTHMIVGLHRAGYLIIAPNNWDKELELTKQLRTWVQATPNNTDWVKIIPNFYKTERTGENMVIKAQVMIGRP